MVAERDEEGGKKEKKKADEPTARVLKWWRLQTSFNVAGLCVRNWG